MKGFGDRARARANELGLSDSEVARRADVDVSRYGKYTRDEREPDFQTLLRICGALDLTPNDLLLPDGSSGPLERRRKLLARIMSSCSGLTDDELEMVTGMIEGASAARRT